MLKAPKVDLGFLKLPVGDKIVKGTKVVGGLNSNPGIFIPPLDISAVLLDGKNTALKGANDQWKAAETHSNLTNRNNKEKDWNHDFKIAAANVNRIANGDEHVMNLGGFDSTTTETTPWAAPGILENVTAVSYDILGGLHFSSDFHEHIEGFVYIVGTGVFNIINDQLIMDKGAILYALKSDTHRKTDMTGLPRRIDMFVWAYGFNRAGCGAISIPIPVYLK